ncbi:MAG: glutamate formimidoyltransferase [Bryobacteraceae bacterium]
MEETLVECVANFSEGRDPAVVNAIRDAIAASPGITVLDLTMDADHHRSVITFAGPPETIADGAFHGIARAADLIDLNRHSGVHPRIGAADVVPFVPLSGVTMAQCVSLAVETGRRVWRELGVPVYLYEEAALLPERKRLEVVRRGGWERLRTEIRTDPSRRPDIGDAVLHPTAGATVIGARKFLIAYNIDLDTPDVEIARQIAVSIRASSGGLPHVKALGVLLRSRNQAQVTINLTDFEVTPVDEVFAAVRREAEARGARIAASELIGLIPRRALDRSSEWLPTVENFSEDSILEVRLRRLREDPAIQ